MILSRKTFEALLIFLLAGMTDILDGFFARLWKQKTKIGAILDPAADKFLMTASYIALSFPALSLNPIPLWLTATIISRDALIAVGALFIYRMTGQSSFYPSPLGKTSTVCQVGTILLVLFCNYLQISPSYLIWVYFLTLTATLLSGIHYIIIGLGQISHPQRN